MALFGEELGELGARYYLRHPLFPLAKTVADINLEQIGRTDSVEGPRVGTFNLTGFDFTDLPEYFRQASAETGIRLVNDPRSGDYFERSDNAAFAEAGVPASTLSVTYEFPDYHAPGDQWIKLDYENMAKVARTTALALWKIASSAQEVRWNKSNPKVEDFVRARGRQ
jgi:Zn-dependent M28 family amino/carboxypeptidase